MKSTIDYYEACELAANILGIADEEDTDSIDEGLMEHYALSSHEFHDLLREIWERVDFSISPLTATPMVGLSNKENNQWIVREEVTSKFITAVITWITEGDLTIKHGFRTITKDGKPEYEIIIKKIEEENTINT